MISWFTPAKRPSFGLFPPFFVLNPLKHPYFTVSAKDVAGINLAKMGALIQIFLAVEIKVGAVYRN